jgi:Binding-prot-dependent transport system membrane comp, N-term/Binding-protein-dependent transport system inner membrane component
VTRRADGVRASRHVTAYRRLLSVYPSAFRRQFGGEMVQVFTTQLAAQRARRGRAGVVGLWCRVAGDLARSAGRERIEGLLGFRWRDIELGGRSDMFRFILRRILVSIPVIVLASMLVFIVIRSTINPLAGCEINPRTTAEGCARLKEQLGLNQPLHVQYVKWLTNFATGHWGTSLLSNRPVFPEIRSALANTLVLGVTATTLSLLIGMGIGMYSALRQYSWFDYASTGAAFVGLSIPNFWFALLLQMFFGLYLTRWLHLGEPIFFTAGMYKPGTLGFDLLDRIRHMILPILVLSV